MSKAALTLFKTAREYQLDRNEARHMRINVTRARGDIAGAGRRWPFELTQNAHDSGVRAGRDGINIRLSFDGSMVDFQHDGRPFAMQDMAALLSGGSSKHFEGQENTGRFGSGFLMTHVLSERIRFSGVVKTDAGLEMVELQLDRGGDEERIAVNTGQSYAAIEAAATLSKFDTSATARFQYECDKPEAAALGIEAFLAALPYLYGTCENLGEVHVAGPDGDARSFLPEPATILEHPEVHIRIRQFRYIHGEGTQDFRALRLRRQVESKASLVLVLAQDGAAWRCLTLSGSAPRIYCRLPVLTSDFLTVGAVIDGRYELTQERDRVLMNADDQAQIAESLSLLPVLNRLAVNEGWIDRARLAQLRMPTVAFGQPLEGAPELKSWWQKQLGVSASAIARLPIVQCRDRNLCALEHTPTAAFVVAGYNRTSPSTLDFVRLWSLGNELVDISLPTQSLAQEWSAIADGWKSLGLTPRCLGLSEIAEIARKDATAFDALRIRGDKLQWLSGFLDVIATLPHNLNRALLLDYLLPDQSQGLSSPDRLQRDGGINESLKDLAKSIGRDARSRLLLPDLVRVMQAQGHQAGITLLEALLPQQMQESDLVAECLAELDKQLPDGKSIPADKAAYRLAAVELLKYLWSSGKQAASAIAEKCPLIALDNSAVRRTVQRKMLAPVSSWPEAAQVFSRLFEADKVLAEDYTRHRDEHSDLVSGLVIWDLAYPEPLVTDVVREIKDQRLRAIAVSGLSAEAPSVSNLRMSQIAMLSTQLLQRTTQSEQLAKLLLGLVLKHVAVADPSWRQPVQQPQKDQPNSPLSLLPAAWLAELKTRAWVPILGEKDGQPCLQAALADAGNLRKLLDPAWLAGNDAGVELLTRHFGFQALDLRLLSLIQGPSERRRVENNLANIVQALGGDPTRYDELASDLLRQNELERLKARNRQFGIAVQQAIEAYFREAGFQPQLIDRGYDYDLWTVGSPLEDATHHVQMGDYLLEIKATTSGEVRLTPLQAQTASEQVARFVLCVVDLRGLPPERIEGQWSREDVEPLARIVPSIGNLTLEAHGLVTQARTCAVAIRNDDALRYAVPPDVWQMGIPLKDWVSQILPQQT